MPYKIEQDENGKWRLRNKETRELLPYKHDSEEDAKSQARAIMMKEHSSTDEYIIETTEKNIRIRQIDPGRFKEGSFRTITLSKSQGIKAIIGRLKGENTTTVQVYLFDKDKWTEASAKNWIKEHKKKKRHSEFIGFDPFAKFEQGKPIRILPLGEWHRGERLLTITEVILQEAEKNFRAGLPRYRVGINLDHAEHQGKVGNITDVAFLPNGPQGPGLYATNYEITQKGLNAIEDDGYDAVSAEMIWTLNNGATYQDPETGEEYDNVLAGVALTPHPFFGHNHVALYSDKSAIQEEHSMDEEKFLERLLGGLKQFFDTREQEEAENQEEVNVMSEQTQVETLGVIDPQDFISREEYEALSVQHIEANDRIEKLEGELTAEKLARQKEKLGVEWESFSVLGVEKDEFVDNMVKLTELDSELAEWVKAKFHGFNEVIETAGLLVEIGTEQPGDTGEFDIDKEAQKILKDEMENDQSRYAEALSEAARRNRAKVAQDVKEG